MGAMNRRGVAASKKQRLAEAMEFLRDLGFAPKQSNEIAAYTLLALLDLEPDHPWPAARSPLRGITPIIEFIARAYRVRYAPNTRETIRDEAVKYFQQALKVEGASEAGIAEAKRSLDQISKQ